MNHLFLHSGFLFLSVPVSSAAFQYFHLSRFHHKPEKKHNLLQYHLLSPSNVSESLIFNYSTIVSYILAVSTI